MRFRRYFRVVGPFVSKSLTILRYPLTIPIVGRNGQTIRDYSYRFFWLFRGFSGPKGFFGRSYVVSAMVVSRYSIRLLEDASTLTSLRVGDALSTVYGYLRKLYGGRSQFLWFTRALPIYEDQTKFRLRGQLSFREARRIVTRSVIVDYVSRDLFVPYEVNVPKGRVCLFHGLGVVWASGVVRRIDDDQGYTSSLSRYYGLVVGRVDDLVDSGTFPIRVRYVGLYLAGLEQALGLIGTIVNVAPRDNAPLVVRIFGDLMFLFRPIAGYFLAR